MLRLLRLLRILRQPHPASGSGSSPTFATCSATPTPCPPRRSSLRSSPWRRRLGAICAASSSTLAACRIGSGSYGISPTTVRLGDRTREGLHDAKTSTTLGPLPAFVPFGFPPGGIRNIRNIGNIRGDLTAMREQQQVWRRCTSPACINLVTTGRCPNHADVVAVDARTARLDEERRLTFVALQVNHADPIQSQAPAPCSEGARRGARTRGGSKPGGDLMKMRRTCVICGTITTDHRCVTCEHTRRQGLYGNEYRRARAEIKDQAKHSGARCYLCGKPIRPHDLLARSDVIQR